MSIEEAVEEEKMMIKRRDCPRRLSEEILMNVLSRLPVKRLLRFRCVCKRWRYLISDDPYFFQLHSHRSRSKSKSKQPLLFLSLPTPDPSKPVPLYKKRRERGPYSFIIKSMDREDEVNPISTFEVTLRHFYAILLPTRFDLICIHDNNLIHICNPSTHQFITLPNPPSPSPPLDYSNVGFGYIQSKDEYKVVRLVFPQYEYGVVEDQLYGIEDEFVVDAASFITKSQVFTIGSSSSSWTWRDTMNCPYTIHFTATNPPVFVNGAIHWLVYYDRLIDTEVYHGHMIDPNNTIIAFDVEKEEFRLIPHPRGCPDLRLLKADEIAAIQLVELKGLLCLSCTLASKMDIWMFNDYHYDSGISAPIGGSWVKEYTIDLNVLPPSHQPVYKNLNYYLPREVEDTKVLIETYMRGLGYYHLPSTSFEEFMDSKQMPMLKFNFYMESLRSIVSNNYHRGTLEAGAKGKE